MLTRKQMAPAIALLVTLISVYLHFTYGQAAIAKPDPGSLLRTVHR